jgi:bacterioferritin
MGHVERIAERILFLKGDVNMAAVGDVERIPGPEQMLAKAAQMEEDSARAYNEAALQCAANADSASKQVFEDLVQDEERHFDEFDKQLENIKRFGLSYLALQSFDRAPEAGSPGAG